MFSGTRKLELWICGNTLYERLWCQVPEEIFAKTSGQRLPKEDHRLPLLRWQTSQRGEEGKKIGTFLCHALHCANTTVRFIRTSSVVHVWLLPCTSLDNSRFTMSLQRCGMQQIDWFSVPCRGVARMFLKVRTTYTHSHSRKTEADQAEDSSFFSAVKTDILAWKNSGVFVLFLFVCFFYGEIFERNK